MNWRKSFKTFLKVKQNAPKGAFFFAYYYQTFFLKCAN